MKGLYRVLILITFILNQAAAIGHNTDEEFVREVTRISDESTELSQLHYAASGRLLRESIIYTQHFLETGEDMTFLKVITYHYLPYLTQPILTTDIDSDGDGSMDIHTYADVRGSTYWHGPKSPLPHAQPETPNPE